MKILMTTDTIGGVWNYSLQLARQLSAWNAHIVLATMGAPLRPEQRDEADALPHVEVHESHYRLCWMADPWGDVAASGQWLQTLASEQAPDLLHLNDFPHGALSWPCPVLMVGHSCVLSWFEAVRGEPAGEQWDRYRDEVARGLRSADLVVAPTEAMLKALHRHYGPLGPSRVIPNGCDGQHYRPSVKQPWVLSAGRLWDEAKNVAALMRAAPHIGWPVAIAGDARHPDGGEIATSGVRLLGRLSTHELAAWYSRSAIYALPARYEPFGLSALEAALSGCALVLGDIPTLREIWGDAACFVSPSDDRALTDALNTLINDPVVRTALARRGRQRALSLTSRNMAQHYMHCYQTLTEDAPLTTVPSCDA